MALAELLMALAKVTDALVNHATRPFTKSISKVALEDPPSFVHVYYGGRDPGPARATVGT